MKTRIWMAERRWLLCSTAELNECRSMELSGVGDSSGNLYTHRRGEETKPRGGFLGRDEANTDRMKGFQQKLGLTQGLLYRMMVRVVV